MNGWVEMGSWVGAKSGGWMDAQVAGWVVRWMGGMDGGDNFPRRNYVKVCVTVFFCVAVMAVCCMRACDFVACAY